MAITLRRSRSQINGVAYRSANGHSP